MDQQPLIYSFVAREGVILADYTEFTGNFTGIAAQCLQKLPNSEKQLRFTFNCDGHTFNYLVKDGFTYCVVAVESVGRQIHIAFLERIKEDFTKKHRGGKAATPVANSLNKKFRSTLKKKMQYFVDHPEEISDEEVEGVMMKDIKAVLDLEERIELHVERTENLRPQRQEVLEKGRAFLSLESKKSDVEETSKKQVANDKDIHQERLVLETDELVSVHNASELLAVRRMTGFSGAVQIIGSIRVRDVRAFKAARPDLQLED